MRRVQVQPNSGSHSTRRPAHATKVAPHPADEQQYAANVSMATIKSETAGDTAHTTSHSMTVADTSPLFAPGTVSSSSTPADESHASGSLSSQLRYIHVDIAGGSNNFGSSSAGGSLSASGGRGGTRAARTKHTLAQQAAGRSPCTARHAHHRLCDTCSPTTRNFADNYISTTKYNLFTFLPMNLFSQFEKKANFYFLLVAIVSLTPLSPKTPVVSVAPLVLVLMVSAVKEALEDFQRYKQDRKVNASLVDTWRSSGDHAAAADTQSAGRGGPTTAGSGFEPVAWADVQVGDVVFVREGQAFPADVILLQSSSAQGLAHIETSNLDGETNLKTKQALPECWRIKVNEEDPGAAVVSGTVAAAAGSLAPAHAHARSRSSNGVGDGGEECLSSRDNPRSKEEGPGLRWPLRLPPLLIESSPPSKRMDGSAWKANLTFLGAPASTAQHHSGASAQQGDGGDSPALAPTSSVTSASTSHAPPAKLALGMSQLLLRGCVLRNTKFIIGVVAFTGTETKLMLNNRAATFKRSRVDRVVDSALYVLFGIEFVLCTLGAGLNYWWMDRHRDLWFLPPVSNIPGEAAASLLTYLVLLDILIPISLYVSMELVKATQAHWISRDIEMYHAESNTPAQARTSNLNEELGQVNYIFTDKTGTLTSNVMNFVACAIGGKEYGLEEMKRAGDPGGGGPVLDDRYQPEAGDGADADADNGTMPVPVPLPAPAPYEPYSVPSFKGVPGVDADFPLKDSPLVRALLNGTSAGGHSPQQIDRFLTLLSVCHTVLPDFPACSRNHVHTLGTNCSAAVTYQASSPDEKALVQAAKNSGYYFYHREPALIPVGVGSGSDAVASASDSGSDNTAAPSGSGSNSGGLVINGERVLVNILGAVSEFLVLDSFEFSSERARMSVVVLDPRDGKIKVLTKGSDAKMARLLSERSRQEDWPRAERSLHHFSQYGLRTLVCASKVLSVGEYLTWAGEYAAAKAAIERREERVAAAQERIEQGLTLCGCSAIEDRLQAGVPQAIQTLSAAGIAIWVLTGDKVETAINIARSCALVTPRMDETGLLELVADEKMSEADALADIKGQLHAALQKVERLAGQLPEGAASDSLAVIVSGAALTHIFSVVRDSRGREIPYERMSSSQRRGADQLRDQFLRICQRCKAVVCCRVSPSQKAEVVTLVKTKQKELITLAIGDGANDVAMIKAAHVGIGISGLEGLQAVMSSDYSIAQFRFLVPLLLVHGHWSYERISKLILYSFYKNITIAMTSIWFAIGSGWSAQLFYDAYAGSVFNIIFTSVPVMLVAVLDRDVSREGLIAHPELYGSGLRNECFNVRLLLRIIGEGVSHSLLLYWCCVALYTGAGDVVQPSGRTHDLWLLSTAMYSYLVVVVNARVALDTTTFTWLNHLFLCLSVLAWFVFALVYCAVGVTPDMLDVAQTMFGTLAFWAGGVVIVAMCLVPEVAWMAARRMLWPTGKDVVMEVERGYGPGRSAAGKLPPVVHVRPVSAASPRKSINSPVNLAASAAPLSPAKDGHSTRDGGGYGAVADSPAPVLAAHHHSHHSHHSAHHQSKRDVSDLGERRPASRNGLFPASSPASSPQVQYQAQAQHPSVYPAIASASASAGHGPSSPSLGSQRLASRRSAAAAAGGDDDAGTGAVISQQRSALHPHDASPPQSARSVHGSQLQAHHQQQPSHSVLAAPSQGGAAVASSNGLASGRLTSQSNRRSISSNRVVAPNSSRRTGGSIVAVSRD